MNDPKAEKQRQELLALMRANRDALARSKAALHQLGLVLGAVAPIVSLLLPADPEPEPHETWRDRPPML